MNGGKELEDGGKRKKSKDKQDQTGRYRNNSRTPSPPKIKLDGSAKAEHTHITAKTEN
jgi:hypothetical protein